MHRVEELGEKERVANENDVCFVVWLWAVGNLREAFGVNTFLSLGINWPLSEQEAAAGIGVEQQFVAGVVPGPVPGVHLPGAKALAGSFAMSRLARDSAPGKTPGKRPFAKAFCILPGFCPWQNATFFVVDGESYH
ncbi:hypothetical protein MTR_2g073180 [Medicago truncatula]|uniref:Uncharacterized protein n=1 Tax=Medicago truncatula TaxID=3880 RepID=A0A072VK63_MEDTR|nr:hypothetical protein MTR_2g073180 [Medicago truncatula]